MDHGDDAGIDRPADRRGDLPGAPHYRSASAERLSQPVEGDGAERARYGLTKLTQVPGARDAPAKVIHHDGDKWQLLTNGALDLGHREGERSIAAQQDHGIVRIDDSCRHGAAQSPADD